MSVPESPRPQDDLFRHINGHWLATHEIPADRATDGAMRELHDRSEDIVRDIITAATDSDGAPGSEAKKVGDLFASFMDTETIEARGLEPLRDDFARIAAAEDHDALLTVLGELETEGVSGLFGAFVSADAKNSERYIVYLTQAGLHLPDEAYYREDQYAPVREKFVAHVEKLAALAGLEEFSGFSPGAFAETILNLETQIAGYHWDVVANRDAEKTYNKHSFSELRDLGEGFDFARWAEAIRADENTFAEVVVSQPSFVTGAAAVWRDRPLEDLKAWALFSTVNSFASMLGDEIVEEHFDFYARTLSGAQEIRERWRRGVSLVESLLGEAVGKIYVEQEFSAEAKAQVRALVDNLIEAYRRSISGLEWMGPETRDRALEKLAQFTPKIGYPDTWREYTAEIVADDLIGNVRRSALAEHDRQLARVGKEIERDEWLMTPQTVNAYYHPVMNEIVFPAAILQPPFFGADADDAENYGAIGAVIGHEIGHGFDDQGSRYDGKGNLVNWWTEEDLASFRERTGALIEQFDSLVPEGIPPENHVNGSLTIGENIGDLGGLGIAWQAYQISLDGKEAPVIDGLTGGQRFFIAWAKAWRSKVRPQERIRRLAIDPHSPEEFRCNQIVRNMDVFHTAFEVTEDDEMFLAPAERVSIWN